MGESWDTGRFFLARVFCLRNTQYLDAIEAWGSFWLSSLSLSGIRFFSYGPGAILFFACLHSG